MEPAADLRFDRILSSYVKLVEFIRRQFCQIPLITFIVVVINIIIYKVFHLRKICAVFNLAANVVFHVTEETFLRCIIPAVSFARHGLAQFFVTKNVNELIAGISCTRFLPAGSAGTGGAACEAGQGFLSWV